MRHVLTGFILSSGSNFVGENPLPTLKIRPAGVSREGRESFEVSSESSHRPDTAYILPVWCTAMQLPNDKPGNL